MRRELEFAYPWPQRKDLVRGFVDLAFEDEKGVTWFLDWKTDLISFNDIPAHSHEHYVIQAELYNLALARWLELRTPEDMTRFGGMVYVYLRHPGNAGIHLVRPDWQKLQNCEKKMAAEGLW
jgi:ATP-dependent exoDNAse (exonuclease V) beta subunit